MTATQAKPNPAQPTSNPPGGGSWTWDFAGQRWQPVAPVPPAAQAAEPDPKE